MRTKIFFNKLLCTTEYWCTISIILSIEHLKLFQNILYLPLWLLHRFFLYFLCRTFFLLCFQSIAWITFPTKCITIIIEANEYLLTHNRNMIMTSFCNCFPLIFFIFILWKVSIIIIKWFSLKKNVNIIYRFHKN